MNFLTRSFYRTGLSLIIDPFDSDGEFLSQETHTHFEVIISFIDYAGLKKKTMLKQTEPCYMKKNTNATFYSQYNSIFMKNIKGCKDIYNILIVKNWKLSNQYPSGKMRVLILVVLTGAKYLSFDSKLQKNQNIIG